MTGQLRRDAWWKGLQKIIARDDRNGILELFDRLSARDDRDERTEKERENTAVDDTEDFERYLPAPNEDAHAWLVEFATKVDMNVAGRRELFSALTSYVDKFGAAAKARELDEETVRGIVEKICQDNKRRSE